MNSMVLRLALLCAAVAWTMPVGAQDKFQSNGPIVFYVDVLCYRMMTNPDSTYLQVQGYMDRTQFRFAPKDTFYLARYSGRVTLKDPNTGHAVGERTWISTLDDRISAADTSLEVPLMFESNQLAKPGTYVLQVTLRDEEDTSRAGMFEMPIDVANFKSDGPLLSGIQLAAQVQKGGQAENMFVKNGYTVTPNPSRLFGTNLPRVFVYAEAYGLDYDQGGTGTCKVEYIVTDEAGSVIKEYPSKSFAKAGSSALILNSINILSLVTGRYVLVVRFSDESQQKTVVNKKPFIVYHEGESISEVSMSGESFFQAVDERGIDRAGNLVALIGSDEEKKIFKGLVEIEGKRKFLDRFWKDRDPSPGTRANEALTDYYVRYEKANQQFSSSNRPGWKSDMGRVYIIYGPPAQVEKHDFERDLPPYQIWYYMQLKDQPTQTIFVFADKSATGIPVLVHSNARGEESNTNWLNSLRQF